MQTAGSAGESIAFGVGVTMPAILILGFGLEFTRVMLVAVLADRALDLGGRMAFGADRALAGRQLEQQDAERIDVRGCRDRLAAHLLGSQAIHYTNSAINAGESDERQLSRLEPNRC